VRPINYTPAMPLHPPGYATPDLQFNEQEVVAISIVARGSGRQRTKWVPLSRGKKPRFYKAWRRGRSEITYSPMSTAKFQYRFPRRWPMEGRSPLGEEDHPVRAEAQLPYPRKRGMSFFSFVVSNDYIHVALLQMAVGAFGDGAT